jgi:hypothetical protein
MSEFREFLGSVGADGVVETAKLAQVATSLSSYDLCASLISSSLPTATELVNVLISIMNNLTMGSRNRIAALGALVSLSRVESDSFRQDVLFPGVCTLNSAFEDLLQERADDQHSLGRQHEQIVTLLFRCTNYQLTVKDLLSQLCNGNDVLLLSLLLNIVRFKTSEPRLLSACLRCTFELTTPASHFEALASGDAPPGASSIAEHSLLEFQQKLHMLLVHLTQSNILKELGDEIVSRWFSYAVIGDPLLPALKYFCRFVTNLVEYAPPTPLVKAFQQSLLANHVSLISTACLGALSKIVREGQFSSRDGLRLANAIYKFMIVASYRPNRPIPDSMREQVTSLTLLIAERIPLMTSAELLISDHIEFLMNTDCSWSDVRPIVTAIQAMGDTPCADGGIGNFAQRVVSALVNSSNATVSTNPLIVERLLDELVLGVPDDEVEQAIQMLNAEISTAVFIISEIQRFFTEASSREDGEDDAGEGDAESSRYDGDGQYSPGGVSARGKRADKKKKKKGSKCKKMKSPHPERYCCMLTGRLMKEPVVIKSTGHWFELSAIEKVVESVGHVDPITGEAFADDIDVDEMLQAEISQYRLKLAAQKSADE